GPDIDNLVVLLALGDQTGRILVFDLLHFPVRAGDELGLRFGDHKVVHTDGGAGTGGVLVAGIHQLIGKNYRGLQAHHAVALVDDPGNRLFGHVLVDHLITDS